MRTGLSVDIMAGWSTLITIFACAVPTEGHPTVLVMAARSKARATLQNAYSLPVRTAPARS
jgi:hypothetical protein